MELQKCLIPPITAFSISKSLIKGYAITSVKTRATATLCQLQIPPNVMLHEQIFCTKFAIT